MPVELVLYSPVSPLLLLKTVPHLLAGCLYNIFFLLLLCHLAFPISFSPFQMLQGLSISFCLHTIRFHLSGNIPLLLFRHVLFLLFFYNVMVVFPSHPVFLLKNIPPVLYKTKNGFLLMLPHSPLSHV